MQNAISFVNEQLWREQARPHRHDCHDPPYTAGMGFLNDRPPPRRLPWAVGSDGWNTGRGKDCQRRCLRGEDCHPELEICPLARLDVAKVAFESFTFNSRPKSCCERHGPLYAWLIESTERSACYIEYTVTSKGFTDPSLQISTLLPGTDPGKDVCMSKTVAVVQLPEILRNKSSHLVKLAGKIDSFSLLLPETPEGELKHSIEQQFHTMVFATRKEIRKYCPRYRSLPGEGILDFNTDCTSGQLEPGDIGIPPPPRRGKLCQTCCFFTGIPEEQLPEMRLPPVPQDLVLVV